MNIKSNKQQNPQKNIKLDRNKHRPENKDNLDSREGEEQQFKGDDITHNKKEHQNQKPGRNKNK